MSQPEPCLPQVLAMVICDTVIDDRISGKKSLIGLFDAIATTHLPCTVNELYVFLALTEHTTKDAEDAQDTSHKKEAIAR